LVHNRVRGSEIEPASDTFGVKTLLQFWSTLQNGDYESGVLFFSPTVVSSVGSATISQLLRELAPLWDSTKPTVVFAAGARESARVYFNVRDLRGRTGPVEVTFARIGGKWKISFLSLIPTVHP
jgi:hypothetical protein